MLASIHDFELGAEVILYLQNAKFRSSESLGLLDRLRNVVCRSRT